MTPTERKYQLAIDIGQKAFNYFNTILPSLRSMQNINLKQLHFLGRQCKYLALLGNEGSRRMPSVNLILNYAKETTEDYRKFDEQVRPFLHPDCNKEQWIKGVEHGAKMHFEAFDNYKKIGQSHYYLTRAYAYALIGRLRSPRLNTLSYQLRAETSGLLFSWLGSLALGLYVVLTLNFNRWFFVPVPPLIFLNIIYNFRKNAACHRLRVALNALLKKQERTSDRCHRFVVASTEVYQVDPVFASIPDFPGSILP